MACISEEQIQEDVRTALDQKHEQRYVEEL